MIRQVNLPNPHQSYDRPGKARGASMGRLIVPSSISGLRDSELGRLFACECASVQIVTSLPLQVLVFRNKQGQGGGYHCALVPDRRRGVLRGR